MSSIAATETTNITAISSDLEIPAARADHAHRWLIAEANGPVSGGTCKICGASKDFRNWIEEADFTTFSERAMAA